MLKTFKPLVFLTALVVILLQLILLFKLQLFGDEAFYWLEGQHLSLSYAELPGWTAWMTRLGTQIFGNHYFAVRFFSYSGFLGVFYAIYLINKQLDTHVGTSLMLVFSVPLYILLATMALPDIWLVVFVVWLVYFFILAIENKKKHQWAVIGVLIALSINVHVRMWIWLFFSAIAFLIIYRKHAQILKSAILISLPIGLLGLVPVLVFNYHSDFALFVFQFGQRHPWEFQLTNVSFALSQLAVITPLVLIVWFKGVFKIKDQPTAIRWIILTAILHGLFYLVTSLFADGLRTTVHWLLISYVPVLIITPKLLQQNKRLVFVAILTGTLASLSLLSLLSLQNIKTSSISSRILDNSIGWQQLANKVKVLQKQHQIKTIIADYFMTAAELAFELNLPNEIKSLPHDKNIKHGRQKQLDIMGLLLKKPENFKQKALVVVEDSTLKLKNKGKYYARLCRYFPQMKLIDSLNIEQTNKQFYLFKINDGGGCMIPPLFYINAILKNDQIIVSGWAILHEIGIETLSLVSKNNSDIKQKSIENIGIAQQFPEIKDPNLPNNGFETIIDASEITNNQFRIKAIDNNGQTHYSQIYYLD